MTEAFSNNLGSHLGRHLLYWAISQSDIWYLGSRCAELINKFSGPYERCLLTLDEDEFAELSINNNYPLNYNHNIENFQLNSNLDENNNEIVNDINNNNIHSNSYEYSNNRNYHQLDQNEMSANLNERNTRRDVETLNSTNGGLLLSPPHNSLHQRDSSNNMQITQPNSAPSSPLASPGAISISPASFCMQSSGSSSTVDTADPNWQATKATVLERNAAMFNNELMSDIKFVVGSDDNIQTIPAHKYILATGSSVFYAMFYGGLAENKSEIKVPDVEPSAFLTLLKYLYCDEIQLEPDNILATLYAAKKYIVPILARACVNYLEVSLTAKNACLLLSQSRLFEEPELMQRCWEVIDAQAEMAIKSEGFVDIDLKTFESILSRETLNCKEIHLFEAALNWAHNACQKMEIDPTAQNKRSVLGSALHLIRIPTMTLEEFANGVAQTGILTSQETIDIFLNFTAKNKPQLNFATKPRAGLKTQVCHRFQSCAYRSNQWRYRGRCDSIQFSVDRRIFIVGFGLYGSSTGAADYNVKIELKRLGRILAENDTKFFSDGSSNTFHVFFENPIQIEPDCNYTASVILDGNELSFFGQEGMSEVCMGKVNFQFQCSSESTNGTGVQGGQIPELIFYGPTNISNDCNSPINSHCTSPLIVGNGVGGSNGNGVGTVSAGNCDEVSNL